MRDPSPFFASLLLTHPTDGTSSASFARTLIPLLSVTTFCIKPVELAPFVVRLAAVVAVVRNRSIEFMLLVRDTLVAMPFPAVRAGGSCPSQRNQSTNYNSQQFPLMKYGAHIVCLPRSLKTCWVVL